MAKAENVVPRLKETPWESMKHPDLRLPKDLQADIQQAEQFSTLMHGAQLLYNLLLSEHFQQEQNKEKYQKQLTNWSNVVADRTDLRSESPLWPIPKDQRHKIREAAKIFVTNWREVGLDDPSGDKARELVRARQAQVKLSNSKLQKPATDEWGGNSGSTKLTFRWSNVVRFIQDIKSAK